MATVVNPLFSDYVFWETVSGAQETFAKGADNLGVTPPFNVAAVAITPKASDLSSGSGSGDDTYAYPIG
jgi:hypothetical protein